MYIIKVLIKHTKLCGDGCKISQYIHVFNHYVVHLKLIKLYVNYMTIKTCKERKEEDERKLERKERTRDGK